MVTPDVIAKDILDAFGGPTKITRTNGDFLGGEQESIATGYKVEDKYTVVKKGDCNGDGTVTSSDYVLIKNYIMGTGKLDDIKQKAADMNEDKNITSSDYVLVKNYIMGK